MTAPGYCGRSEQTFNRAKGAFIVNVSRPVRAIRSYIGANSGPYTATTDIFYPRRQDSVTNLRVHTLPGVMAFDDFTAGLAGADALWYTDSRTARVPINGLNDAVSASPPPTWQMVSGGPGALVTTRSVTTDIPNLDVRVLPRSTSGRPEPVHRRRGRVGPKRSGGHGRRRRATRMHEPDDLRRQRQLSRGGWASDRQLLHGNAVPVLRCA
jgi:hypothetical protein